MSLHITHGPVLRGGRTVLEGGVLEVPAPAAVAIVGVNGSGKTSLFMHLTDTLARRLARPSIAVHGRAASVAYVPQTPALPPWLRVEEAVALYGHSFADVSAAMPGMYLDEMSGRRVAALSLGQHQALSAAISLAMDPDLLIMDEPFAALDFRRRLALLDLLRQRTVRRPECALLLSSQNAADLLDVCTWFVAIRDGHRVFNGARDELTGGGDAGAVLQRAESRLLELLS